MIYQWLTQTALTNQRREDITNAKGKKLRNSSNQDQKAKKLWIINGHIMDVTAAAQFLGITPKSLRALVARRVVPFHRLNARIIFIKDELIQFFAELPGCTLDEAKQQLERRNEL